MKSIQGASVRHYNKTFAMPIQISLSIHFSIFIGKYKSFWSPVKKFRSAHSLFRKYCSYSEDMSSDKVTRGVFVVLEGCDRCGKTTQSKLLVHSLKNRGLSAQFLQFPGKCSVDYLFYYCFMKAHYCFCYVS